MTDVDPLESRARSAAARLLAEMPASPPPLVEARRRSNQRAVRRAGAAAGLVAVIGVGIAVPLSVSQPSRSDLEGPTAAKALDGPWRLPAPSASVEVEVPVSHQPSASAPIRPTVQARPAAGPWRARISGRTLVLRNPSTDAIVVQHIDFFAPGQFSVQEPPSSGSTAGFGCTADGEYSWDLEDGRLDVDAISDPCADRVAVLEAGTWTNVPPVDNGTTVGPETTETPTSDDGGTTEPTTSETPSEEVPASPGPS
jgi:hypothetical protein